MPLPGILGDFWSQSTKGKNREISEKVGKFRGNIGKSRKKSEKRNFGGDILSIFTDNRYFADISAEISEILFP